MLHYPTKQLSCYMELLVRVLGEELVLLEQVFDHAEEYVRLSLYPAGLELTKEFEHFVDSQSRVGRVLKHTT